MRFARIQLAMDPPAQEPEPAADTGAAVRRTTTTMRNRRLVANDEERAPITSSLDDREEGDGIGRTEPEPEPAEQDEAPNTAAQSPDSDPMQITFAAAAHHTASMSHRLGIDWTLDEVTGFMFIKHIHAHSEAAKHPRLSPGMQLLRIDSVDVPLVRLAEGKTCSRIVGEQVVQMLRDAPLPLTLTFAASVVGSASATTSGNHILLESPLGPGPELEPQLEPESDVNLIPQTNP